MGNFDRGGYRGGRDRDGYRSGGRSFDRGRDFGRGGGDRPMYKAICSVCGRECEVPFRPTSGKPVYCSEHFEKMGGRRFDMDRPERSDRPQPNFDQNKNQFDSLNTKLDKIISLLEPKVVAPVVLPAPVMEEVKEGEAPKPKPDSAKASTGKKVAKKKTSAKEK